jgi:PHP family Zn ribbon phosphoesterase
LGSFSLGKSDAVADQKFGLPMTEQWCLSSFALRKPFEASIIQFIDTGIHCSSLCHKIEELCYLPYLYHPALHTRFLNPLVRRLPFKKINRCFQEAPSASLMNRYRSVPGLSSQQKATPSTTCQKCLKKDRAPLQIAFVGKPS